MAFRKAFDMIGNYSLSHDSDQGNNNILLFSILHHHSLCYKVHFYYSDMKI